MSRPVRLFLLGYTCALILAEARAYYGQSHTIEDAFCYWQVPVAYLILAIGAHVRRADEFELPRRWVFTVFVLGLLGTLALCHPGLSGYPTLVEALGTFAFSLLYCVLSLAVFSATPQYFRRSQRRWAKVVSIVAALTGVALILASLVTKTSDANGWEVAMQRARWATAEYNVARLLPESRLATWAHGFLPLAGSILYLLILIDAILIAIWIFRLRGSNRRLGSSRFFLGLAATSSFLTFCLHSDIFWGWQSVLWEEVNPMDEGFLNGAVGFDLWVAAPAFVCWIILHALKQGSCRRSLLTIQILQLPIAGFNFTLVYFLIQNDLDIPGLGLLIVGSQMLAFASIGLLLIANGQEEPAPRPEADALVSSPQVPEAEHRIHLTMVFATAHDQQTLLRGRMLAGFQK